MVKRTKCFLFIFGLLIFLVSTISLFFVSINAGTVIILGFSCILILYGLFLEKLTKLKWLTYGVSASCAAFLMMILFIFFYGKADNVTFTEDAVIVFGAGIKGERVTKLLSHRLDKAAEYSLKNPDAIIVVSGGQGAGEDITEALAMERYLIEKGIAEERIIKEEAATSTYENILYSKKILEKLFESPYEIVVITNDFHIYRAANLAKKSGLSVTHYNAGTKWYNIPTVYSRECIAVLKMWILGK